MLDYLSLGQNRRTDPSTRFGCSIQWDWVAFAVLTASADVVTGIEKGHEGASMLGDEQNHGIKSEWTHTSCRLSDIDAHWVNGWLWVTDHGRWMIYLQRPTTRLIRYITESTESLNLMTYVSRRRRYRWKCSVRCWSNQDVSGTLTTVDCRICSRKWETIKHRY